jgi:PPOX class probable F420-dependent enzyme
MELSMTPDERLAFISDTPRVGVLSIEAPDRGPVSSPVWYTVKADRTITFAVGEASRKTTLLRAAGRATMCVQSEVAPYSYVTMEGAVTEIGAATDESRRARAHRYLGEEFGEMYFESTRAEPDLTFALLPKRWASIDYAKLFG